MLVPQDLGTPQEVLFKSEANRVIGNTFRTAEPLLHNLLERVQRGVVQLPDFQRKWVWDDMRIQRLRNLST